MKTIRAIMWAFAGLMMFSRAVFAGDTDPLFVNLTTDHGHRAQMALVFSKNQIERKHPVTIFLNDRGVLLGSKATSKRFKVQQETIAALIKQGATILICPMCMKHYGVKDTDVLEGIKVGSPELTGGGLFKDNTKTMSW